MTHPEGYTPLDLVGFTDRGTYASNVSYVKNDIAHYAGSLYRCKIDDTINVTPGENANWTVFIGEPKNLVERIIAPLEDNPATVAYTAGRQIIYDDFLWEVIDDIAVGDALIDYDVDPTNANIKKSLPVETQLLEVKAREGNLATLLTTVKTTLVAAINELVGKIGDLTGLTTTAKTSAVAAINEVDASTGIVQAQVSGSGDAYSTSKAYAVGDLCIYNNVLYRCITACSAGSWTTNQSCFTADTLVNVADGLSGKLVRYSFLEATKDNITDSSQYQTLCELNCSQGIGLYLVHAIMNFNNTAPARMKIDVYNNSNILQYVGMHTYNSRIVVMTVVCPVSNSTDKIRLSGNWETDATGCSANLSIVKILGY